LILHLQKIHQNCRLYVEKVLSENTTHAEHSRRPTPLDAIQRTVLTVGVWHFVQLFCCNSAERQRLKMQQVFAWHETQTLMKH